MALPKKSPVQHVLKLYHELSPEEHEEFMREIKLEQLRKGIQIAADQLDRGEGVPGEQVFAELKEYLMQEGNNK